MSVLDPSLPNRLPRSLSDLAAIRAGIEGWQEEERGVGVEHDARRGS